MLVVIHQTNLLSASCSSAMHHDISKHYLTIKNNYQHSITNADLTQTQSKESKNLAKPYPTSRSRGRAIGPNLDQEATKMRFVPFQNKTHCYI